MLVFLTKDLMVFSAARSVLPQEEVLKQVTGVKRLSELAAENAIQVLMVDLQTPGLNLDELAEVCANFEVEPKMVLFAQHVNVELLEQAKQRFSNVMTRGQFNSKLPAILSKD